MTPEELLKIIEECAKDDWAESDLEARTEHILTFIARNNYTGKQEDIEEIADTINVRMDPRPVLFVVEDILREEGWNFANFF